MALQDTQKEAIIFYLGWPAKTLVVDSTHYSKIVADRMTNLSEPTEKKVKAILAKLEAIDTQLDEARCRLTANKVADEVKASSRKSLAVEADATDNKQVDQSAQKLIDNFDVPVYSFSANITIAIG